MKKRILSLILALSMVLSVLPLGAFAEGSNGKLIIGSDGYPVGSEGGSKYCSGNDNGNVWEYYDSSRILCLNDGGTFDLSTTEPVECKISSAATITGGTFNGAVENIVGTISGGIFNGTVTNASTGKISGGTFAGSVTNDGTIENGTFNGSVTNSGNINKGTFNGTVANGGTITGGVFNLNAKPIGVTGGHNITWDAASSKANIVAVNDVSANWKPYAYAGTTVTITASTKIYSLNGKRIGTDYDSSYPNKNDKTTVTFTMPDENVVLSTGELVIGSDGYPVGSNGGKDFCSGNDWEYSDYSGTLYLSAGAFDLSTTEPVKCKIQSRTTITGGTFNGAVKIIAATITKGIFNETVYNSDGTISGGTFQSTGSVTNWGDITGGTFAGSVENKCDIYGGVFNCNATLTDVPNGYSITWDKAYPNAKITEVNGVSAEWDPYVVVTDEAKTKVVTITANTDIYSLNGKSIGTDYNSSYPIENDKTTVTFTMPGENVVLSTGELVIDSDGYPVGTSGKGWSYDNNTKTLYLNSGRYDFSTTQPVQCAIQSYATITGGTFAGSVANGNTIENGTFNGTVTNNGTISGGAFTGQVDNKFIIKGGTFRGEVTNSGTITGNSTTFEKLVTNGGTINNGTFAAGLSTNPGIVNYGAFNGDRELTNALQVTVTNGSVLKVNGVDPRNADGTTGTAWDLYSYARTTMTITASTEIFSLNGQPIDESNYPNKNDKTTVTFTMPGENVVLSTGELVMAGGYPEASNNGTDKGTISCSGNGWSYDHNTKTLTLTSNSGTYDFGLANPQDTTNKTLADSDVACKIEIQSGVEITGGTFNGIVTNNDGGTISGGTFKSTGSVTNNGYITGNGTFEGKVTNDVTGYITGGTFQSTCSVTNTGIIKDGIFTIKVENGGIGEIFGGIFAAGLSKKSGNVAGGVFNGKTGLDGVTGLHSITWDAASSKAKIVAVNDVSAVWDLYTYKGTTVTITADTEIYSLNGQPIDESSYPDTTDKKTVKFTMPDEDVVLNRTVELEVVDGEIESGETAEGSGRVRIGGKVEVTTKDKTQDFVGWTIAPEGIELRHDDGSAVDLTSERTFSFMMPDVSGGKLTLTANYQPFRTSLLMNADGTVNLEHVNHETYDGNETCKGDGWNVFNRGTLILENGTYDFRYTAPTEKTGTLEAVTCGVQNKGGTIENGVFRNLVLNEVGGTITGGTFAVGLFEMPGMTSGTVTGGVFNGKTGLTNAHHVTVTDGSLLKVNGEDPLKVDETTGAVTTGTAWDLYSYAGTTVTITADTDIFSLNGQPIGTGNCNSSYPDENDKTTVTFTMPDKDVVLNEEINYGDLVMENGYPEASNGGTTACKGDGWEYIKNDPTNGDMLLLTGNSQTGGLYDFSAIGDGSAVECNVFVGKPTAITGGEFNGKVFNNSGILGGTFNGEVDNRAPGTIEKGTFNGAVENNGIIENGTFNDAVKNNGTINDGAFNGKVDNMASGTINDGAFHGAVENNGTIENGAFHDAVKNNGTINDGAFNGTVENNGTIEKGTFHDAVENKGTINGGTFNGAVTDNGTISGNITGSGTLNGKPITKTEPTPEPEPTTYTVTVIGGTIDGKTSVSAKENDTLTVVLDQSDIPDGMAFDLWSISSDKLSGDINVDYRAEAMTFQMPAEDVTIRAQYRSAEIIEDAAPSPLATAATIAVGGAAAGIVVWQGVSLGVDLYLANALPQGVPVPTDRRALALLLWETAGKPEVALPTLYGDIPAEEIELQKATRWAIQNGLMDAADKKDASFFDPDHYVTKMDVFGAWLRLKKLLGTT